MIRCGVLGSDVLRQWFGELVIFDPPGLFRPSLFLVCCFFEREEILFVETRQSWHRWIKDPLADPLQFLVWAQRRPVRLVFCGHSGPEQVAGFLPSCFS